MRIFTGKEKGMIYHIDGVKLLCGIKHSKEIAYKGGSHIIRLVSPNAVSMPLSLCTVKIVSNASVAIHPGPLTAERLEI